MMRGLIISVVALVAVLGGVSARPGNKIVGGEAVNIEDYPYQVSLEVLELHFCGASIIGKKEIVTAAHCTDGWTPSSLNVRVGSTYHASGGQVIKVADIKQHPQYDSGTMNNDISIIILKEDIIFSESAMPVDLPEEGQIVSAGTNAVVTGWGVLWSNGPVPAHLQGVTLPIVSNEECQASYPRENITDKMICAGDTVNGGIDACQGDSGGPLVANGKLFGVVSWGYGCADAKHPGIFTNVANLRSFVKENAGI